MLFTFWTDPATEEANEEANRSPRANSSAVEWRKFFPEFKIYDDQDSLDVLQSISPEYVDMYNKIMLPACRSDLARLLLLYGHGGMYVDAHTHPINISSMATIFSLLSRYEFVIFDQVKDRATPDSLSIANGALCGRRHSPTIRKVIDVVLRKLHKQMDAEAAAGTYVPYNIAVLSGSWAILETVFDLSKSRPLPMREDFAGKVYKYPYVKDDELTPFDFYRHYNYREPGQHWSEKQKWMRLFKD